MGNRAVITHYESAHTVGEIGLYLHWNGGEDSVLPFLMYAKMQGVRGPKDDHDYFYARMCQIIGNFFGGTLYIGVGRLSTLDKANGDNGVYLIDNSLKVVGRVFAYCEYPCSEMRMVRFLKCIDERQPSHMQFGKDLVKKYREVTGKVKNETTTRA